MGCSVRPVVLNAGVAHLPFSKETHGVRHSNSSVLDAVRTKSIQWGEKKMLSRVGTIYEELIKNGGYVYAHPSFGCWVLNPEGTDNIPVRENKFNDMVDARLLKRLSKEEFDWVLIKRPEYLVRRIKTGTVIPYGPSHAASNLDEAVTICGLEMKEGMWGVESQGKDAIPTCKKCRAVLYNQT